MKSVRDLFSTRRPIDRPIEKVIDYYASSDEQLEREIEEYEITGSVEKGFERFLSVFGEGVRGTNVNEIGIWISGFYGSGKSSFTKYLGFSLQGREVRSTPFIKHLCSRFGTATLAAELQTLAKDYPVAVIFLDLGAEQLAGNSLETVSNVIYWKVLQQAGYSKEKKLARLEFTLEERGLLAAFESAYQEKFKAPWRAIHDDPLIGVARASQLVTQFLPLEYKSGTEFLAQKFEEATDLRALTEDIIKIIRKHSGREHILFLIDEVGQYVAPRGNLILNLDGFARNLKELGQGKVWIAGTGQQTLAEIIERAAFNTTELNKLRDRFPIPISLEASDIREITYRRLLSKSPEGEKRLREEFARSGQALLQHTRLEGTVLFKGDADAESFVRFYPFLPQHFDLLFELIRILARSTGGIGLRSAIRVIQDILVDVSRSLPAGSERVADRPIGQLACADDFFDTLRVDIAKVHPDVIHGVERVARAFPRDPLALRVAKAIAALQPVESFPKTAENLAALLHPGLGTASCLPAVKETLARLVASGECSLVDDPLAGGFVFLSEAIKPLRDKRNNYTPSSTETNHFRTSTIKQVFEPLPSARVEETKDVKAGIRWGRLPIAGDDADVQIRIEASEAGAFEARKQELLAESMRSENDSTAFLLVTVPGDFEDTSVDACRSQWIVNQTPITQADREVAQFVRTEQKSLEKARTRAVDLLRQALFAGVFIFRGTPTPASSLGESLLAASRKMTETAALKVFSKLRLAPLRATTDLAQKFLQVENLSAMSPERDPLALVKRPHGKAQVDVHHPAFQEVLRVFKEKAQYSGTGRVSGRDLQNLFTAPPYGFTKDTTRYLFAGLLAAAEIEVHGPEGVVKTPGRQAAEIFKTSVSFDRAGIAERNSRPSMEALDRASTALQRMTTVSVLPLEPQIAQTVMQHVPRFLEDLASLPDRLRLLGVPGEGRARHLVEVLADLTQEQGAAAIAILGAASDSTPEDLAWARKVEKALDDGVEREIQKLKAEIESCKRVANDFPSPAGNLLTEADRTVIHEVLGSDSFAERLPVLRSSMMALRTRLAQQVTEARNSLADRVRAVRDLLEATREWPRLSTEDQASIAREMEAFLPGEGEAASPDLFHRLLLKELSLPQLEARLMNEIRKRAPEIVVPDPTKKIEGPKVVSIVNVLPAAPLQSSAEVEAWLQDLRNLLLEALESGGTVEIR